MMKTHEGKGRTAKPIQKPITGTMQASSPATKAKPFVKGQRQTKGKSTYP